MTMHNRPFDRWEDFYADTLLKAMADGEVSVAYDDEQTAVNVRTYFYRFITVVKEAPEASEDLKRAARHVRMLIEGHKLTFIFDESKDWKDSHRRQLD